MTAYAVAAERDFTYGFLFGNHATTPDFDATSWTALNTVGLPVEGSVEFKKNAAQRRPNRANGFRHLRTGDALNDIKGVSPTVSITMPAIKEHLAYWLYGIFQNVSEAASTPYIKDYTYAATGSHKDFSANEGAFFTLVKKAEVTTTACAGILTAIPQTITLSCYPGQNEGRLTLAIDFVGRYHQENQTYSGTLTYPAAMTYFNVADLKTTTYDGADCLLYGFSFTMTNNLKQIPVPGYSASGKCCQNIVIPYYHTTGSIDVLYSSKTLAASADEAATPAADVPLVIAWGSGASPITTDGDLLIKANVLVNNQTPQGSEESVRRIEFECRESGTAEAFEVHFADAVDRAF